MHETAIFGIKNGFFSKEDWLSTLIPVLLIGAILFFPEITYAANLPWETPLGKITTSLTGPVAFSISLLGIIGSGATLIWGGEINQFIRTIIYIVLVIALIVSSTTVLSSIFGVTG